MGKLIVCGDSYMSPVVNYPKTHFSEIIADRLGYELIPYSRSGMSNGGIAIQIDTAIQEKPDLILVGTTYPDRIEFPINDPKPSDRFTVQDICYDHSPFSLSSNVEFFAEDPQLISTNVVEIISNSYGRTFEKCDEPDKKERAIKDWFRYLYHPDWKNQTDKWMMYAVLHQLHESNIPYIVCRDPLNVVPMCSWLKYDSLVWDINKMMDSSAPAMPDVSYHTSFETQIEIAEYLLSYMKDK